MSAAKRPRSEPPMVGPTGPSVDRPVMPIAYNVAVRDVMTRAVVTVGPEASLLDALLLLRTHDVTGLPVVDAGGSVIGVVSQKDLARSVEAPAEVPGVKGLLDVLMIGVMDQPVHLLAKLRSALEVLNVRSAMSRPVFVVRPDAPLELAMEVMAENDLGRLPVVDAGRLVGIVTPTDLISAGFRRRSGIEPGRGPVAAPVPRIAPARAL